jgi:hypothetical protein
MVDSGRGASGQWDGNGIVTSQSAAIGSVALTTLAVMAASDAKLTNSSQFGGQSMNPADVLVGYTYTGDANLSGFIDGDDYFRIDRNFNKSGSVFGYANGDFNYDGAINADDYFIIDANIGLQGAPFPQGDVASGATVAGAQAVPEPAGAIVLAGALAGLVRRRRHIRCAERIQFLIP